MRLVIVIAHGRAMAQTLLLALAGLTFGFQQPTEPPQQPFTDHQEIADTFRLAMTPKLDGTLDDEEWDPLLSRGDASTYFEWEPDKLHLAAKAPIEDDIVFSFDLKNNGWLVGRDNLEVRLRRTEGGVQVRGRVLDADNKSGPKWIEMPGIATAANVSSTVEPDGKTWIVEATLTDPGTGFLPDGAGRIGMRADAISQGAPEAPTYIPRVLNQVKLGFKRSTGLPGGVYWEPQGEGRYVTPGRGLQIRYTFKGDNTAGFDRISMRSEGFARQQTNILEIPFPKFDKKNRAFVDYDTSVIKEAAEGYRVARCVITSKDGATAVGQASYRVAPTMDMELVREERKRSSSAGAMKVTVYLRSNSPKKMDGTFKLTPPSGFTVITGNDKPFVLYTKGSVRRVIEITVPPGAVGTFPIELTSKVGPEEYHQTAYLTIQYLGAER